MLSKPADLTPAQGLALQQARNLAQTAAKGAYPLFGQNETLQKKLVSIALGTHLDGVSVNAVAHLWGRTLYEAAEDLILPQNNHQERRTRQQLRRVLYVAAEKMLMTHTSAAGERPIIIAELLAKCQAGKDTIGHSRRSEPMSLNPLL